ncbi:transmembrane protein 147 [Hyalella azteca]|uniref:BOS complex subunit TMEM147 n=1 Tax=Hyalella azteca TaxID=294128 RepID=A0A8B7MZ15_HYAAZ|nr:transmembrane protein 147 [Hyalella azteca]
MTFYHLGNCLFLAYGPYFLTYKYFELSEYGAFWKCVQVGGMYLLTQLCKMLLLATFFPADLPSPAGISLLTEIFKSTMDFGDLFAISLVLRKISASGPIKVLIAGLGWSTADMVLTRVLPLWVGARGLQFDWKYIIMSLEANVVMVHHLAVTALVYLWSRTDSSSPHRPLLALLAVCSVYCPLLPAIYTAVLAGSAPTAFNMLLASSVPSLLLSAASLTLLVQQCPS